VGAEQGQGARRKVRASIVVAQHAAHFAKEEQNLETLISTPVHL